MRKRLRSHALLREKSAARKAAEQSYSSDDICAHNARERRRADVDAPIIRACKILQRERKAVPEAAKVDVEAEKSRIIEYQGLITGIKRQELVWNAVSGALL